MVAVALVGSVDSSQPPNFLLIPFFFWGLLSQKGVTGQEQQQKTPKGFTADKCCDSQDCLRPSVSQSFNLPPKFFRIPGHDGSLLVEQKGVQSCEGGEWEEIEVNLTSQVKFRGKSDAFYGRDKLWHNDRSYGRRDFCVSKISAEELRLNVCTRNCSKSNPCIPRCCKFERVFNLTDINSPSCIFLEPGQFWNPLGRSSEEEGSSKNAPSYFLPTMEGEDCNYYSLVPHKMKEFNHRLFRIESDGSVWRKVRRRHWKRMEAEGSAFCIENAVLYPWDVNTSFSISNLTLSDRNAVILECQKDEEEVEDSPEGVDVRLVVVAAGLLFFSFFSVVTCVVYVGLKEKEPVHRWTVVALTAAMAVNFVMLGIAKLSFLIFPQRLPSNYFTLCTAIGIVANYSFLTSLAWLSAANFDIWLTFRFLRPGRRSTRRLWIYTAVAFLSPAVIVGTGVTLDLIYKDDLETDVISPQYGRYVCGVEPWSAPWPFIYGPMALVLLLNLALYISTGVAVLRAKSQATFARSSSTQAAHSTRDAFFLFFRLLLVMGIPWVCEWTSWLTGPDSHHSHPPLYIDLLDFIVVTQPAATFVVLVLKKDVKKSLSSRYPFLTSCCSKIYPGGSVRKVRAFWGGRSSSSESKSKETEESGVSGSSGKNDIELKPPQQSTH